MATTRQREAHLVAIAVLILLGFFAVLGYRLYIGHDVQLEIGALISIVTTATMYFFGSSRGSDRKTEIMANGHANPKEGA